jgi:DNA primase
MASGGAVLTPAQIAKIRILGPRKGIILSPDNDKAGIKSIISNAKLLDGEGYKLYYSLPPKLPFQKGDETKYTKDWNEILEELKVSREEVRARHDKGILPITAKNLAALHRLTG